MYGLLMHFLIKTDLYVCSRSDSSPDHYVCVVTGLAKMAAPADPFTVDREVLSDPQYWVRQALPLALPELAVE